MAAPDDVIAKTVASLRDTFKVETVAPGHCAGEPMFAALKKAYGDRYLYAGLGPTLTLGLKMGSDVRRGEGPALQEDDLTAFRRLARREDPLAYGRKFTNKSFASGYAPATSPRYRLS